LSPRLIKKLSRPGGSGEVWEVGKYRVLVLPEKDISYVCAEDVTSRAEQDWLTDEIEKVAKASGFWLKTAPSIDVMMIVVRAADVPAFLQACADHFGST
jgi:hypothetical protein